MKKILSLFSVFFFLFFSIANASYLGSWKIDDYLTFSCNTHDPDTGVATDAASAPTYRIYEDETASAILTGSTAKLDDGNTTGFYTEQIQLTAANGLEKGKSYTIYIAATVDTDTGTMSHNFQIEAGVDSPTVAEFEARSIVSGDYTVVGDTMAAVTTVNGLAANVITATSINADAITAVKVAADVHAESADAVWDETLTGATHNIPTSAGRRLRALASQAIRLETAQGGTASTITLDAAASPTDNIYVGAVIILVEGTGAEQTKTIVAYNGTTKVVTINGTWRINPDNTSVFQIWASAHTEHIAHGTAQAGTAGSITLAATGSSAVDDYYNDQFAHLVSGTGANQVRLISDYNGTSKVALITPNWATNPDNTTVYHIDIGGRVDVAMVGGTSQTANDNGADINEILTDTGTTLENRLIAIEADTNATLNDTDDIGVAGAGLSDVPWNASWDTDAQSEVADALDAAIPAAPTDGSINSKIKRLRR